MLSTNYLLPCKLHTLSVLNETHKIHPRYGHIFNKMGGCTKNTMKNLLLRRIPIVQWLPKYDKVKFISDFIAGITVGLTMIPQSLAYASLADLPPQYGLYTAFMGSFAYVFFGTIKEASIGPTSLMALLVYSYTEGKPLEYVILLCFLSGCIEFLMGVLKLGTRASNKPVSNNDFLVF